MGVALSEKTIMKLQNGSDVRGVAVEGVADEPVNLTVEAANRIAAGFLDFLSHKLDKKKSELRVAVGHDSRVSAKSIKKAVLGALTAAGAKAVDCGMASTPAMFMSIVFEETKMDGSIMITASHLPYNRNGMKFFTRDGGTEKGDVIEILKGAVRNPELTGDLSRVEKFNLIDCYSRHLCEKIR
ncbi:MAG: phosphomannomutase/phosphoglucomutase, partial [Selenomonadaceae bacterium]|nr:phosphomannomutase/phosphoglucomutase [Selenomonadaceae bacterium]